MEDLTGKQFGPYQIVAPLGEGGMAAVYKAYQPRMERYVALKVLPRYFASDPQFVGRFEQEAKVLARLLHPHILPVHDFGEADGYTYIVMPFIESGTLAGLLHGEPLSLPDIERVITQVGDALDYAHGKGVVHRDVKPSNILIDPSGNCLLTDFGIAKMVEGTAHFTRTGGIVGTPAYMSPEQIQGEELDGRSDIYSLGIVLYEMATGRPPYRAETPPAIFVKHLHDPLPPPRALNTDLPEAVERVILKALAKKREDRYATANDMVQALRAAISIVRQEGAVETAEVPGQPAETAVVSTGPSYPTRSPAMPSQVTAKVPYRQPGSTRWILAAVGVIVAVVAIGSVVGLVALGSLWASKRGGGGPTTEAAVLPSSTPGVYESATPEATETPAASVPSPDEEGTRLAEMGATQTVQAAEVQRTATVVAIAQTIASARAGSPIFGPQSGSLSHQEDGAVETKNANVDLRDFVAEAVFFNPYPTTKGSWDMGFMFRDAGKNNEFRLIVESNGNWNLYDRQGDKSRVIQQGHLPYLDVSTGGSNRLMLVAQGDRGFFSVNDDFIADLDLSSRTDSGDVSLVIGAITGHEISGEATPFNDFTVWSLAPQTERAAEARPPTSTPEAKPPLSTPEARPPTSTPVVPAPQPTSTAGTLPGTETVPLADLAPSIPWLPLDNNAVPGTFYYGFNVNKPPFDNRLVRQAFAAAVDRKAVADLGHSFGADSARPATTFTPPETLGRDLYGEVGLAFDLGKAQTLLAEAGYPNGQGFPAVTLVTNRGGTSGHNPEYADAIAAMWREHLSVDVKVEVIDDWQAYLDLLARDAPAIYRLGWAADVNDPDNFLKRVFHSQSESNYGHFSNAEFDRLVEQAATSSDPATRQELYIQAERILCEDEAAMIPLYHYSYQNQ